jgi:hypothetical protein
MTGDPAVVRAALATSGSQRIWLFAVTVTGGLVIVGSIALAQIFGGSMRWEGNR